MRKQAKRQKLLAILSIVVLLSIFFGVNIFFSDNEVETLSRYGSTGSEVTQIQTKLKRWGYYNGNIDGVYGSKTVAAVRNFQAKNGLKVDGIAGQKTLQAMGIYTSTSNSGRSNNSDLNLLAHLIYAEARGEPYAGQVAVGAVVLNRVKSSSFPNSVAGVIYQSGAFSVVSDGQINYSPNNTAISAARDAMNGWDPTYGCIYYFNPNTATSSWIWSRPHVITIGNHRFCR